MRKHHFTLRASCTCTNIRVDIFLGIEIPQKSEYNSQVTWCSKIPICVQRFKKNPIFKGNATNFRHFQLEYYG